MSNGISGINRLVPGLVEPGKTKVSSPLTNEKADEGKFSDLLGNMLNSVNDIQGEAKVAQDAFLNGDPVELHDVMIKGEEAGLAMDLLLEIRNRLVSAYNEIMKMPI